MKLKFTAGFGFDSYEEFTDGAVCEVEDKRGEYLLATFGGHFSLVAEVKQAEAPTNNRAARAPKSNK